MQKYSRKLRTMITDLTDLTGQPRLRAVADSDLRLATGGRSFPMTTNHSGAGATDDVTN